MIGQEKGHAIVIVVISEKGVRSVPIFTINLKQRQQILPVTNAMFLVPRVVLGPLRMTVLLAVLDTY